MRLPEKPRAKDDLLRDLEAYKEDDIQWKTGRTFGFVYDPGNEAMEVGKAAYTALLTENGLDPTSFPSVLRLEKEVISMVRAHVGGGDDVQGTFTSGGTESIFLAVKAARDHARATRPEVTAPEVVIPLTGHAAFYKACHYLGVAVRTTPVLEGSFLPDLRALEEAIGPSTILVVASAPGYAHGVVDPVPEIAAIAARKGVLCHVDACVGGWLLPWFRRLGVEMPAYDFSVPGVTSMSVDLHKYAFAPKGASVVLFRPPALRMRAAYACARWAGYSVFNMAVQSSKSGGPIAAAWAVLQSLGEPGYADLARTMHDATRAIVDGVARIEGVRVLGRPHMSVLAIAGSAEVGIFHVIDELLVRGWYVQPQLRRGPSPENLHLTIGPTNAKWVDAFLADLATAAAAARGRPASPLAEQTRAAFSDMDPAAVSDETIAAMMSMAGAGEGGKLPERLAEVNEILNALPPALVERAILTFIDGLYRA
jgi:glutamate/tyrosine decarboxylase-like PLP-dependent enzyme